MKELELYPPIEIINNFKLELILGEEGYIQDTEFQQFEAFYLHYDLGIEDEYGDIEFLILSFNRDDYYMLSDEFKYEIEQMPGEVGLSDVDHVLDSEKSIEALTFAIDQLIDRHESQNFFD